MNRLVALMCMLTLMCYNAVAQQHPWIHVYQYIEDFLSIKADCVESIIHSKGSDGFEHMILMTTDGMVYQLPISDIDEVVVGTNVPTIYLNLIDHPEWTNVQSKVDYERCLIRVDGNGIVDDLEEQEVNIRGRGNSTWNFPKKPYRLKFDKKKEVCGMKLAKSYALIANYIDPSHLRNAVALKIGQMLSLPYTNSWIPVRVYFNDTLQGLYFITEKIGLNSGSVDIDEDLGVMYELDTNYDEDYKFYSDIYGLPVMIKDPDLSEYAAGDAMLEKWHRKFSEFEQAVSTKVADLSDVLDMESFVDYLLVYNICCNQEINHPRSVNMYCVDEDDVMHFGPIWDFDWAFNYSKAGETTSTSSYILTPSKTQLGGQLFYAIASRSDFMALYRQRQAEFIENHLDELYAFIDEAAMMIKPAAKENGLIWPESANTARCSFDTVAKVAELKDWIARRISFITTHRNCGLYN